jgi:ankyrin repeat protein
MLLGARADLNMLDDASHTALDEACKHGHDRGAKLGFSGVKAATVLCTCVFDGNMPLLKRYLAAGVSINAGDYDLRTALHISAAEGNLTAVRAVAALAQKC